MLTLRQLLIFSYFILLKWLHEVLAVGEVMR